MHTSFRKPLVKCPCTHPWWIDLWPNIQNMKVRWGMRRQRTWTQSLHGHTLPSDLSCWKQFSGQVFQSWERAFFCGAHQKWVWKFPSCLKALQSWRELFILPGLVQSRELQRFGRNGPSCHFLYSWQERRCHSPCPEQRRRSRHSGYSPSTRLCLSWDVDQWGSQLRRSLGHTTTQVGLEDPDEPTYVVVLGQICTTCKTLKVLRMHDN